MIINVVLCHHGFSDFIVTNKGSLFILKFWLLIYNFFNIKRWLFITFYLQIDNWIKMQNSTMEAYP